MKSVRHKTVSGWAANLKAKIRIAIGIGFGGKAEKWHGGRTEDEFLRRGEHVQREGDFILVFFELHPAD
jgi:hypothetical protein